MFKRILPLFVLLIVPALAWTDNASQPAAKPPALVIRVASLDNLFDHLDLLGSVTGQSNLGKELQDQFKKKLGAKGLYAIDAKRPIGFYGAMSADGKETPGVLMVPITDDKAFKKMVEAMGCEVSNPKNGVYTIKQDVVPGDVQYRVEGNYVYLGVVGQSSLDNLPKPETIFTQKKQPALSITLRLDQVPEALRMQIRDGFKEGFNGAVENKGAQSNAQKAFASAVLREFTEFLDSVFVDGQDLSAEIDIDPKTKKLAGELSLSPKAGTKFAQNIAKLGQRKSMFAGILEKDAAMNGLLNFDMPAGLREAAGGLLQDAIDRAMADLRDEVRKKQAADLFDAIKPSLTAEDLDVGFSIRGPGKGKHFTLVAGMKLRQGDKLLATLIKLIGDLPENERSTVKLNADKAGNVAIHSLDLQKSLDANVKELFGEHPLHLAMRSDALFVAMGEDGLAGIKQAIVAQPQLTAPLQFDISLARLATILENNPAAASAAKEMQQAGDDGRIQLSIEGGTTLRLRGSLALSAFKLFGQEK